MNPLTWFDVIRTDLVKDVAVKDGLVTIHVDIPEDHQFATTIEEDIKEKIKTRWDIKKIHVSFTRDQSWRNVTTILLKKDIFGKILGYW